MTKKQRPLSGSPERLSSLGAKYEYHMNVYLLVKMQLCIRSPFVGGMEDNYLHRRKHLNSGLQSGLTSLAG